MRVKNSLSFFTRFAVIALLIGATLAVFADPQSSKPLKQQESFTRPKPSGSTAPQMPTENRMQEDKIFLEQADSLYRTDLSEDIKIVKGNVIFRQGGMVLTCDSAYFYTEQDRADCFGNVKMQQGDTLFMYADRLYYNGIRQFASLRNGPTAPKVKLINRLDTLITDSLDYNLGMRLGWYDQGGELRDPTTTLTSLYGQYSPQTKDAEFFYNVVLINRKDNFKLYSDTLYYNTATGIARIDSRTKIEGENDTIITTGGTYNTKTGFADLTQRSLILHRDSNQNVVTLEGDSIIFNRDTEVSKAYRFNAPGKRSRPVVLTDTANKSILIGGEGFYDNKNRTSMATDYPLLMEYSKGDTIFLRADTIRTFVVSTEMEDQESSDGIQVETTEDETLLGNGEEPEEISETELEMTEEATGEEDVISETEIEATETDNMTENSPDNETESSPDDEMGNPPDIGEETVSNESPPEESPREEDVLPGDENPEREDFTEALEEVIPEGPDVNFEEEITAGSEEIIPEVAEQKNIEGVKDETPETPKEYYLAKAYNRARFFRKDIQGIADSITYVGLDSMLYLNRRPVVWSEERQISGDIIEVHLNDSTADWVRLPENGIMMEHVDEDFYNQLSAKKMFATLENGELKRLEAEGNVMAIMLPQEDDQSYTKFVNAESSFLDVFFAEQDFEHLKMWPQVNGTVTPIGQVADEAKLLRGAVWLDVIRPERRWYGGRVEWDDELGEISDELEEYFVSGTVPGSKSPSGFRLQSDETIVDTISPNPEESDSIENDENLENEESDSESSENPENKEPADKEIEKESPEETTIQE